MESFLSIQRLEDAKTASKVCKKLSPKKQLKPKRIVQDVTESQIVTAALIEMVDMSAKIARDLNTVNADGVNDRRRALQKLHKTLFVDYSMSTIDYNFVFRDTCKVIFKRFCDTSEKCRELSLKITQSFFQSASDFVPVLAYFFPVLMQRLPGGLAYDEDMKVFVTDMETHEAYRRGKAVERQDKTGGATGPLTHSVVEESEEIRLLACKTLGCLLRKTISIGASSVLHPYFHEIIMYLQMQLRDPFPDLKVEACEVVELLARTEEFNSGMKFFAVALARCVLPLLRHRHAKVRVAGVRCLNSCVVIPDRAKLKGSGSEAIADLVGFREENVLQVSSYYRADVQVNYLAELVTDSSVRVKESVVELLREFMTVMGDRYDHQTRLLPYLLDLITDDTPSVSTGALSVLSYCGQQYEEEHPDEVIERRQYGVDGDNNINISKALPFPFTERPRIGMRLYVRGNSKRFLTALVNELTNWIGTTRVKSARLLRIVVVLCEEHLTMEVHTLLPSLVKALRFASDDSQKDKDLYDILLEVFELMGRYVSPASYLHYMLPRIQADAEVSSFGADTETRIAVMHALQAMVEGSKSSQVIPFFSEVIATLTDSYVIDPDSPRLIEGALKVLTALLSSLHGRGQATLAAVYMNTGRLASLNTAIGKLFKFFITVISAEHTTAKITEFKQKMVNKNNGSSSISVNSSFDMSIRGLQYLVELENEGGGARTGTCVGVGVGAKAGIEGISARTGTGAVAGIATGTGTGAGTETGTGAGTGTWAGAGTWVSSGSTKGMKELFQRHSPLLLESILPIIIDEKHKKKSTDIANKGNNENDNDNDIDSDNIDTLVRAKERFDSDNKNENRNQNILENNREISFATMEDTDFRILRFLVSSPWGFLGTPHVLDSLLNVLLLSCKRMFLNNNQDVLQMEEKLLSYADMMISLLIPFSYFLYPPSDNQKLSYPNSLFNSLENWDEIFKNSEIEKTVAVDEMSENILNLNLDLNSDLSLTEEDVTILETIKDVCNDYKLQSFWPGLLLSSYIKQSKNSIVDTNDTNNNNSNNNNDNSDNTNNSNGNGNSDSNNYDNNNSEVKRKYYSNPINEEEKRINSLLNVISGKLKDILETFLQRSVWLRSTTLQGKQMEILNVLAGYSGGSVISRFQTMVPSSFNTLQTKENIQINELQDKNSPGTSIVCNNITTSNSDTIAEEKEHQNCSKIFPLICREFSTIIETSKPNSVSSTRNSKSLLVHYFSTMVHFISISLQPNQKASRRMAGIEFLEHLFTLLTYELPERSIRSENIPEQFSHYCSGRKIMSYAIRDDIRENNFHGNFEGEIFDTCEHDKVYKNLCGACSVGVVVALSALSDASDAVCVAALGALYASVPLIMQDQIKSKLRIDEITGDTGGGGGGGEEEESRSSVTYSSVLNRLLLEITSNDYIKSPANKPDDSVKKSDNSVSDDTTTLPLMLDPLLRQLGMLDPELFHKTVKTVLGDYLLLHKNSTNGPEYSENIPRTSKDEVDAGMVDEREITQNSHIINILSDLLDHGSVLITFKCIGGTN